LIAGCQTVGATPLEAKKRRLFEKKRKQTDRQTNKQPKMQTVNKQIKDETIRKKM